MSLPALLANPFLILFIAVIVLVVCIVWLRLHAFIALLIAAFIVAILTPSSNIQLFAINNGMSPEQISEILNKSIGERIAMAFGNTTAQIGILIAMAAVIGKCLLESGGAERIVRSIIKLTGLRKTPIAFLVSSFFLSIPVFFDTVFYLMVPIARAMAVRLKKNYLLLILAIAAGGASAHALIPPTPGPLFLATELQIPLHMMIIGGSLVCIFMVISGYLYAIWINKTLPIPLRDSPDSEIEQIEELSTKDIKQMPSLWLSTLPIIVPLLLISINGIMQAYLEGNTNITIGNNVITMASFLGDKNTALLIGGLFAILLLIKQKWGNLDLIYKSLQDSLMSGGLIILITAAGGAFGSMLQQTGISLKIEELTKGYQIALIPLSFFVTAFIRTAQGSATVSMITAAGILAGITSNSILEFHPLYLGIAIACGSQLFPWMNDSGFWVICKMSNFTTEEMLKSFSIMITIMGITGLLITYIAAMVFPLI